jgi:hypothetical protein
MSDCELYMRSTRASGAPVIGVMVADCEPAVIVSYRLARASRQVTSAGAPLDRRWLTRPSRGQDILPV